MIICVGVVDSSLIAREPKTQNSGRPFENLKSSTLTQELTLNSKECEANNRTCQNMSNINVIIITLNTRKYSFQMLSLL